MKKLDEILEEYGGNCAEWVEDGRVNGKPTSKEKIKKEARTAIISLMKSIVPPEPLFWANMSKGLRNYNEGKRDYRKEVLKVLEGE